MATVPGVTVPVTVDYADDQSRRAAALNAARQALGRSSGPFTTKTVTADETDALLAVAQWVLDGTRELDAATLESFDTHSGESDEPVRTDAHPWPLGTRVVVVGREDLVTVLDAASRVFDSGTPGVRAWGRLRDAVTP